MLSPEADTSDPHQRALSYRAVAAQKREAALGPRPSEDYYLNLVVASEERSDQRADKDRRQIGKDLHRTFGALRPPQDGAVAQWLLPALRRVLSAYVERGRALCATSLTLGLPDAGSRRIGLGVATSARGLLNGYPQGLNFLAGMSLLCAGAGLQGEVVNAELEEAAFWLLAALMEDVLDPDFFGADVKGNLQMAYIGGLGLRTIILELAEHECPAMFEALGHEAFQSSLSAVVEQWVLSLFIGCAPYGVLEELWDQLLLPSPRQLAERGPPVPRGLATVAAFALAALRCCGEERLAGTQELRMLGDRRREGLPSEELTILAGDAMQEIRSSLAHWPETLESQRHLLETESRILRGLVADGNGYLRIWQQVRERKQRIADCAGSVDEQFMALARRTHFSIQEIERLRTELRQLQAQQNRGGSMLAGLDLETFRSLVQRAVPEFPQELCGRLFQKLDTFGNGRLAFVELACGMSALSLGTMDEKLQVCFDLFDSEGRRALTLTNVGDLCAVLFRVALAQGFDGTRTHNTDEVLTPRRDRPPLSPVLGGSSPKPAARLQQAQLTQLLPPTETRDCRRRSLPNAAVVLSCPLPDRMIVSDPKDLPWRSMLLRLLAAARVHTPGGPRLVAFEDFRAAARAEPALLCLFAWCLPRTPERSGPCFSCGGRASDRDGMAAVLCRCFRDWLTPGKPLGDESPSRSPARRRS